MATTTYNVTEQGRLWIAPRNSTGVTGAMIEVGDADNLQLSFAQTFTDVFESQTGLRANAVHALTQTDATVTLDILNFDGANLARALFGSTAGVAAATVTAEAQKCYNGGSIWIVPGATSVVLKKGATTCVLNTDYTYDVTNGRINVLTGSTVITATTGTGDACTVDYVHTGWVAKVQALTQGLKDFKLVHEAIGFDGTISRHEIHRVVLDMTKTIALITTGVNKLALTGKLLPAPEVTTAGMSQYYQKYQK